LKNIKQKKRFYDASYVIVLHGPLNGVLRCPLDSISYLFLDLQNFFSFLTAHLTNSLFISFWINFRPVWILNIPRWVKFVYNLWNNPFRYDPFKLNIKFICNVIVRKSELMIKNNEIFFFLIEPITRILHVVLVSNVEWNYIFRLKCVNLIYCETSRGFLYYGTFCMSDRKSELFFFGGGGFLVFPFLQK